MREGKGDGSKDERRERGRGDGYLTELNVRYSRFRSINLVSSTIREKKHDSIGVHLITSKVKFTDRYPLLSDIPDSLT